MIYFTINIAKKLKLKRNIVFSKKDWIGLFNNFPCLYKLAFKPLLQKMFKINKTSSFVMNRQFKKDIPGHNL